MGLRVDDLAALDYGMIVDMMIESGNDAEKYDQIATQADFDRF